MFSWKYFLERRLSACFLVILLFGISVFVEVSIRGFIFISDKLNLSVSILVFVEVSLRVVCLQLLLILL